MDEITALIHLCFLVFILALIYGKLCQIADLLREGVNKPKPTDVKTRILQTLSGKVFTVKRKRKVVYADDHEAWRREHVAAGNIPDGKEED